MARLLVLAVAFLVAIAAPVIAYVVYPGEAPLTGSRSTVGHEAPVFVEALRHSHYYRGLHTLAGAVEKLFGHGFVLDTPRGRVLVVLPRCMVVGGEPVPGRVVAQTLTGRHVVVRGHVFIVHGLVLVRPVALIVDGHVIGVKPCPRPLHSIHHG